MTKPDRPEPVPFTEEELDWLHVNLFRPLLLEFLERNKRKEQQNETPQNPNL